MHRHQPGNQQPAGNQPSADRDAAARRDADLKAAADSVAVSRKAQDEEIAQRRLAEDEELADARTRLEELRRAQAAADARATLFRGVLDRLKKLVDADDLKIAMREGRLVLQLANDVLFDSGSADVKPRESKLPFLQLLACKRP